jgi:hypothetical protein
MAVTFAGFSLENRLPPLKQAQNEDGFFATKSVAGKSVKQELKLIKAWQRPQSD